MHPGPGWIRGGPTQACREHAEEAQQRRRPALGQPGGTPRLGRAAVFRLVSDALGHLSPRRVVHRIPRCRRRARDPPGSQAPRPSGPSGLWPAPTSAAPSLPLSMPAPAAADHLHCQPSRPGALHVHRSTRRPRAARLSRIWPTGTGTRLPCSAWKAAKSDGGCINSPEEPLLKTNLRPRSIKRQEAAKDRTFLPIFFSSAMKKPSQACA